MNTRNFNDFVPCHRIHLAAAHFYFVLNGYVLIIFFSFSQIYKLMKLDSYSRFLKSPLYRQCVLCEMKDVPLPLEENSRDISVCNSICSYFPYCFSNIFIPKLNIRYMQFTLRGIVFCQDILISHIIRHSACCRDRQAGCPLMSCH